MLELIDKVDERVNEVEDKKLEHIRHLVQVLEDQRDGGNLDAASGSSKEHEAENASKDDQSDGDGEQSDDCSDTKLLPEDLAPLFFYNKGPQQRADYYDKSIPAFMRVWWDDLGKRSNGRCKPSGKEELDRGIC